MSDGPHWGMPWQFAESNFPPPPVARTTHWSCFFEPSALLMRGCDGTVNLIGSGRDKAHEGRSHEGLCPSGHAGNLSPGLKGLGSGGSILVGGAVVAAEMEEIVDPVMGGEEALGLARRLEPLHLPFSLSCRLMGVFGPVDTA